MFDVAPLTVAELGRHPGLERSLSSLNNQFAIELSLLEEGGLKTLIESPFWAGRVGTSAMLIAFDQDAPHPSPNFNWFSARFERFVYIDRVVTDPACRRQGLARRLYECLIERSRAHGHTRVCCEVNADPPNPGSDAFHADLGFVRVGAATIPNGKRVSYLDLRLDLH